MSSAWAGSPATAPQVAHCQVTCLSPPSGSTALVVVSVTGCVDSFVSWTPSTRSCPCCTEQAPVSWVSAGTPASENAEAGPDSREDGVGEPDGAGRAVPPRASWPAAYPAASPTTSATAASTPAARDGRQLGGRQLGSRDEAQPGSRSCRPPSSTRSPVSGSSDTRRLCRQVPVLRAVETAVVRPRLVVAEEVLHLGGRVLRAVARVQDQAGDRDVLTGVEGDQPAVRLALVLDVGGARLGVDVRSEAEAGGRPAGDDGAHHL